MALPTQKLVHTFSALADLGQEITDSSDFEQMVLTSLHLLLGALGIRRGAVGVFASAERELQFVAVRGLDDEFPAALAISDRQQAELLRAGLVALALEGLDEQQPELCQLLERCSSTSPLRLKLCIPMVVRGGLVGVVLLGEKATVEPFTSEDREIVASM